MILWVYVRDAIGPFITLVYFTSAQMDDYTVDVSQSGGGERAPDCNRSDLMCLHSGVHIRVRVAWVPLPASKAFVAWLHKRQKQSFTTQALQEVPQTIKVHSGPRVRCQVKRIQKDQSVSPALLGLPHHQTLSFSWVYSIDCLLMLSLCFLLFSRPTDAIEYKTYPVVVLPLPSCTGNRWVSNGAPLSFFTSLHCTAHLSLSHQSTSENDLQSDTPTATLPHLIYSTQT